MCAATAGLTGPASRLASRAMSIRIIHLVLAALAAVTFSSCSALNSINQTAGRALNAVQRTVMR
jgi:hypothetical protein